METPAPAGEMRHSQATIGRHGPALRARVKVNKKRARRRMELGVRVLRALGVTAGVYGGIVLGFVAGPIAVPGSAFAQLASAIVVQGNRRVEADTIRGYF